MAKRDYIAKSDGTLLWDHSCEVHDLSMALLDEAGITDAVLKNAVELASLFHDIGKTMSKYQEFVKQPREVQDKRPYTDTYPRHNEVSAALFKALRICSTGTNIERLITAAIQYHHTCTGNNMPLGELYGDEEIKEVAGFVRNFCEECGIVIRDIDLSGDRIENIKEQPVTLLPQFGFIEDDEIVFDKIRYLGYYKVVFDVVRYADLIVSSDGVHRMLRPNHVITDRNFNLPDSFDPVRWKDQDSVIERLYSFNYSLLKATMGYGKTLCGLKYLLKSDKLGIWVCPDNSVAQVTYDNIIRTLKICGVDDIRVSLLLNGQWMYGSDRTDIVVTNIDTFENGTFRNSRKEISFKCLFANAIFDEYHEYLMDDNPLSSMFLSAIDARKRMKNVKTLLMSGTIANGRHFLNIEPDRIITADDSNMESMKRIKIHYLSSKEIIPTFSAKKNYFIVYSAIKTCQSAYGKFGDLCIHSRFDKNDLSDKNRKLFLSNGKNADGDGSSVVSTSTISRAYDLSFGSALLVNPNPYQILQSTGRINRWEYDSQIGELYIVTDEDAIAKGIYQSREISYFPKNSMSKKRAYTLWENVYRPYIEEMRKRFHEGEVITIAKLDKFMSEYFRNNNTIRKITEITLMNSFKKLKMIEFRKGSSISLEKHDKSFTSDGMDVRGDNMNRFVCVQIEGEVFGTMSGIMSLPSFAFGNKGFDVLDNGDALSDIIAYFSLNHEIAARYFGEERLDKKLKSYKKNPHRLHTVLLNMALNSENPYPVFGKYVYSHEIGFFKKN